MERLSSGQERLDRILGGGLPAHGINMIIGAPGTGKTILAGQYAFHNGTVGRPALYYSTVSEPYDKLLRYGQELAFFDPTAVGTRVVYESLGGVLREEGLAGVRRQVEEGIKQYRPGVIVIDSFRALAVFGDQREFREFLHDFADLFTAFPTSVFWVGEYLTGDVAIAPEFAVADAIIAMGREDVVVREMRHLQVLKLRGSGFLSGKHACRISTAGVGVFPRFAGPDHETGYTLTDERVSTGVAAFDALLSEGYLAGSSTLVAGPTGVGKTLAGLHFIFDAVRRGEPAVIATLQEHPAQLDRVVRSFGWSLTEPSLDLLYTPSVDLYVDEWLYAVLDRIETTGAKRLLIDSLGDLQAASADEMRFREYVYTLLLRCVRRGVNVLMTLEIEELFEVTRLTHERFSHLPDNVVLLQYVRAGSELARALTVVKSRGISHDPRSHQFEITPAGLVLSREVSLAETTPRGD